MCKSNTSRSHDGEEVTQRRAKSVGVESGVGYLDTALADCLSTQGSMGWRGLCLSVRGGCVGSIPCLPKHKHASILWGPPLIGITGSSESMENSSESRTISFDAHTSWIETAVFAVPPGIDSHSTAYSIRGYGTKCTNPPVDWLWPFHPWMRHPHGTSAIFIWIYPLCFYFAIAYHILTYFNF